MFNEASVKECTSMVAMEDRWLSVEEICGHLGVSNDTVYKWIDQNGMPAHRMGWLWKFRKKEVDDWVKSGGAAVKPKTSRKAGNSRTGKGK